MASRLESLLARDRAAERLRLLSQVSAGLIHEVKNSLAGARLALQLYQLDPKQESEALEMALQQLSTIEETLARFLHADGTLPWNPESILLADCVAHAMTAAKNRATHLGVSVQFEPRSTTPVHADPRLIIHAIGNLINNALDAAGPNGEVRVEITETENFQHVIVRDNGSGIDPQLAPRLGEPFTSGKDAGVGLGLTVVKGIADRAGGSLQWHRRDDGWTEFILAIPVPSHSTKT
jgi:signal transduction histidine kinase